MPFLVDTFFELLNGASLADHTPNTGGAWEPTGFSTTVDAGAIDLVIISNRCQAETNVNASGATHRNTADPAADEYDIEVTMSFRAPAQVNRVHWLCWRMTPTGTANDAVDRYLLTGHTPDAAWTLRKMVAGVETLLDSAPATLAGNVFAVRVEVRNDGMGVYIDDVLTLSSADTEITQRGRVGLGAGRGDSNQWMDDLSAEAVGGEEPVPELTASLPLTLDVAATVDAPAAAVPELTAPVPLTLEAAATLADPGVQTPTITATLPLTLDIAATLDAPEATVPELAATLALHLGAGATVRHPFAPVPRVPQPTLTAVEDRKTLAAALDRPALTAAADRATLNATHDPAALTAVTDRPTLQAVET